jgi:nucleotide-binding universal stress UspA family protein
MFKHLLIPTDGSELSKKAMRAAIAFARETGARVTGYYALETRPAQVFGEGYRFPDAKMADEHERVLREAGVQHLKAIGKAANDAGVAFDSIVSEAVSPHEGIVNAARERDCDVIFMASHGRKGLARVALGSVTNDVLTHSTIPVLVYR